MSPQSMLDYLRDLEQHNAQEWFHANKARYQQAKGDFEALVGTLLLELQRIDPAIPTLEPAKLTFKVQRDTRFSADKSPYNPCFRAHIGPQGKLPIPVGYFLFVQPGGRSFLGGGLFADVFKDATSRIREAISTRGEEWNQIVTAPAFREYFTVEGSALKNVPQGYDKNHPQAEYLKYKSWYIELPVGDEQIAADNFVEFAVERFARMQPFHTFLNRALEGFEMPTR